MARRRSLRLYPLVCIVDECQNLFMHPQLRQAGRRTTPAYVIRLGRAYGIILVLATQRPDSQMLPTSISGNVTLRFCLQGPRPGRERHDPRHARATRTATTRRRSGRRPTPGSAGCKAEGDPQVVRTYYLDLPAAERIAERARVLRGQAGTLTGYALGEDDASPRAVVRRRRPGGVRRRGQAVVARRSPPRLAEQLPGVYADITAAAVASQLRGLGVTVKNVREPGGQPAQGCRADRDRGGHAMTTVTRSYSR